MKSTILLLAAGIIGGVPVAAHASNNPELIDGQSDSGFFFGASAGLTKLRVTSAALDGAGTNDEAGFKIFGGYQLNRYISFEGAYYKPGKVKESEAGDTLTVDADIFQFSAVGSYPIAQRVNLFARVGWERWDSTLTAVTGEGSGTLKDNGVDLLWGVGISANLTDNLSLRAELEQSEIDAPIGDLPLTWRLRFISVGMKYRF